MSYQDYILRQIQLAGRAWARIVRLIKDRQFETAHMVLDQAYRQLIGLSPEAVLERTPNDLIAFRNGIRPSGIKAEGFAINPS